MNGTLRDDENQICQNCGGVGHRKYDCPEQRNFTANIICRICGSAGHMARDCTVRRDPNAVFNDSPPPPNGPPGVPGPKGFDSEYASLMAELGEGGAVGGGNDPVKPSWGATAPGVPQVANSDLPPWRRPEVWQSAGLGGTQSGQSQGGYRPPQPGYGGVGVYGGASGGYGGAPQGYGQGTYPSYQAPYGQQSQDYSGAYAQYYQQQYSQQQSPQ